jgi:tetratricopeptide (TPR) repeat protein
MQALLFRQNKKCFSPVMLALLVLATCSSAQSSRAADFQMEGFENIKAKNFAKAIECFNKALKEHPNSWQTLQNVGNCHSELGHYDTALSYFQKSIEAGGLHGSQCQNIAGAYQKLGDNKKAVAWLKLACSVDPNKAADPYVQGTLRNLENPINNPSGEPNAPDYLAGVVSIRRWPKEVMPIKVYVRDNPQVPGIGKVYHDVVKESLDQWCKASANAISYKFVDKLDGANLICDYTDRPEQVRPDHDLGTEGSTESQVRLKDNAMEWADVVLLVRDNPGASFRERLTLLKLCLHEMGHALGLKGHSPNSHDVMFYTTTNPDVPATLSERDKNTIRLMYTASAAGQNNAR